MKTFSVLALVTQSNLEANLNEIIPHIEQSIHEKNNDLMTYSLSIFYYSFRQKNDMISSETAQTQSSKINTILMEALKHNQSRIVSDTLRVIGLFIH